MEQKASALTIKAQEDADKKIAQAKLQADTEFKSQYEKIVSDFEKSYLKKTSELESKKESDLASFKSKISASELDKKSFNSFLDSVLFA
jgi:vacuolar-type H+-ATPase subunit H